MFGFFKKKKPTNVLDEVIFAIYGNTPPPKRANLEAAIILASDVLLMGRVGRSEIIRLAENLNSGPIPYSTHELALSVAQNFFEQPEYSTHLRDAQMMARHQALQWGKQGLVIPVLVMGFENALYKFYEPSPSSEYSEHIKDDSSFEKLLLLAEQGDANSQCDLGNMYEFGQGVAQNYQQSTFWYLKAAEQGVADAQNNLGVLYERGDGILLDEQQAIECYRRAAKQGFKQAQYNLGRMYFNGKGISKSYRQAVAWFRKAAKQGVADAQNSLGVLYEMGDGVPLDEKKSYEWYRKAADQGLATAQCNLGKVYFHGRGVSKSYRQAISWFRKAAEQGNMEAQYSVGHMYFCGEGVDSDNVEALKWISIADDGGYQKAIEARKKVESFMMDEQITEAQQRAKAWIKENSLEIMC